MCQVDLRKREFRLVVQQQEQQVFILRQLRTRDMVLTSLVPPTNPGVIVQSRCHMHAILKKVGCLDGRLHVAMSPEREACYDIKAVIKPRARE